MGDDDALDAVPVGSGGSRWLEASWAFGLLLLAALIVVVLEVGRERQFAVLVERAAPAWLLVAAVLQAGTYLALAAIWRLVLARTGATRSLLTLARLGLVKLFTDQAVPSAGISGTLLVVRGLERRGVSRGIAMAAVLVDLLGYYAAYGVAIGMSLGILWYHHDLTGLVLLLAVAFVAVATLIPSAILRLTQADAPPPPRWLHRLPGLEPLRRAMSDAPPGVVRDRGLLARAVLWNLLIFLLDAGTLEVMLRAVGAPAGLPAVFAAFMVASVAATIGIVPGGLGTFEAACVAMLGVFGVPVAAGLAGTLLLRGFTFWLPMVPGLLLARRELGRQEPVR